MKGFDSRFKDFPDYILGITHEIWEERQVDTLHHYYAPNIIVRSPEALVIGNQSVITATHATLAEFPDRQLLGEDVIWSGTPEEGMLSSHRILSTATHTGDGAYGPASGKRLTYRVIADCHAKNNTIDDEWLIRDQGAIVRQLGWEPKAFAADRLAAAGEAGTAKAVFTPDIDVEGPYKGRGNDDPWGQQFADLLARLVAGEAKAVEAGYDRAAELAYPGHVTGHGHADALAFWGGLRTAFPSAEFEIHHQIGRGDDQDMPPRAALRWSLRGRHDGDGPFGPPSGADVYVFGMSHAEFGPRGLRREFTLFDETAIWKQILMKTG